MTSQVDPAAWTNVFAFLEHEARFQAAAAAITGAAAAWWLKGLLAPSTESASPPHPIASRLAASLLALASFFFFVDQGRVAGKYGQLARHIALGEQPSRELTSSLVRDVWSSAAIKAWLPYYAGRTLLIVVGLIVLWMLFWPARMRARDDR